MTDQLALDVALPSPDQSYRIIPLTYSQVSFVDESDYESLAQFDWQAKWNKYTKSYYAIRRIGRNEIVLMHRQIMMPPLGLIVDHRISGKTLDNRRLNLRWATYSQNNHNHRLPRSNTSGYHGVSLCRGKWQSRISINGRQKHLGYFTSAILAATAYDSAAISVYGEFANINFKTQTLQALPLQASA